MEMVPLKGKNIFFLVFILDPIPLLSINPETCSNFFSPNPDTRQTRTPSPRDIDITQCNVEVEPKYGDQEALRQRHPRLVIPLKGLTSRCKRVFSLEKSFTGTG